MVIKGPVSIASGHNDGDLTLSGKSLPSEVVSIDNQMSMTFMSDTVETRSGFHAKYKAGNQISANIDDGPT